MKASGEDFLSPRFGRSSISVPGDSQTKPQEQSSSKPPEIILTNPNVKRKISIAEYTGHSSSSLPPSKRKAMFVVNGEVYDGTAFLDEHPGGADSIWLAAGELDATEDFIAIHSDDAKRKLVPVSRLEIRREARRV
jgi:nitrate reductase (NAD(P)H)